MAHRVRVLGPVQGSLGPTPDLPRRTTEGRGVTVGVARVPPGRNPRMIALISEYHLLTDAEKKKVTMLVLDDGTWTPEQVETYIENHFGTTELTLHPDRWDTRK